MNKKINFKKVNKITIKIKDNKEYIKHIWNNVLIPHKEVPRDIWNLFVKTEAYLTLKRFEEGYDSNDHVH